MNHVFPEIFESRTLVHRNHGPKRFTKKGAFEADKLKLIDRPGLGWPSGMSSGPSPMHESKESHPTPPPQV